jgi:ubiquinone/menaquinone biosynthesis C-methylase UbiE
MTTSFEHDSRGLAEMYDRVSDQQLEGGKRIAERLGLTDGSRILDVGCGTGRLAHWLAERVGSTGVVAGIDPLQERIDIARSRGGTARFEVGRAEDLGAFADASFDMVCMSSVLHWVDDKAKALAEIRRVLVPGGRLGATTLAQDLSRAGTVGQVLGPLLARGSYGHVDLSALTFGRHGCSSSDLISLIIESGLELVELHIMQRSRNYGSGQELVEFLEASSFGNLLRTVPEEHRDALRTDLIAAFDARKGQEGIAVRGWGLMFTATRP